MHFNTIYTTYIFVTVHSKTRSDTFLNQQITGLEDTTLYEDNLLK